MALGQNNSPRYQSKSYKVPLCVSTKENKKKLKLAINKDKPLLSYQVEGIRFLWELHNKGDGVGGIIGDDMGVGKTYQLCIFIISLFQSYLIEKALVVCPGTLMDQWSKEFLDSGLHASIYHGVEKASALESIENGGVIITSYETLVSNIQSLSSHKWDYLVIDEGHVIKNPKTVRNNCIKDVTANHRVLLTGTMFQNNIEELWPLLNFCSPLVFDDLKHFRDSYCKPIYCGTNKNSTVQQEYGYEVASKLLRKAIRPYYIRRTKEQVLKLPKKHEVTIWLILTESQRLLYQRFVNDPEVRSAISNDNAAFEAIAIQQKICNDPLSIMKGDGSRQVSSKFASILEEYLLNNDDVQSSKLLFLDKLLCDLCKNGHYVLIFSQMKDMLSKIQEMPAAREYNCLRIDGECPLEDRFSKVNEFQAGSAQILCLTSKVGGVGLTLTKADRVIILEPSWNHSTDDQIVCRAYRLGQKNDVIVYRLITCGTVEESTYRRQIYKQMLSKVVMEEERPLAYFTEKERKEIFQINKDAFRKSVTQQKLDSQHICKCEMNHYVEKHLSFLRQSNLVAGIGHHAHLFSEPDPPDKSSNSVKKVTEAIPDPPNKSSNSVKKVAEATPQPLEEVKKKFLPVCSSRSKNKEMVRGVSKNKLESASRERVKLSAADQGKHSDAMLKEFKTSNRPIAKKQPPIPQQVIVHSTRYIGSKREMCLQIPSEMAHGVSKDKLETASRACVKFLDGDQPNITIARITGTAEQVLTAKSLIIEQIKQLSAADQGKHS